MLLSASSAPADLLRPGQKAPSFLLPGLDGRFHSLATDRGEKATLLVFWSNGCPICEKHDRALGQLGKDLAPQGVNVVAINSGDYYDLVRENWQNMQAKAGMGRFAFPYLRDPVQQTARDYGVLRTPTAFILSPRDEVLFVGDASRLSRPPEDDPLRLALQDVIAGRPVAVPSVTPTGTIIKWSAMLRIHPRTPKPGDVARPQFMLATDGHFYELRPSLPGTTAFVFMSNSSPAALAYEDRLLAMAQEFVGPGGVAFYFINSNDAAQDPAESFEKMRARASEKRYRVPYLKDEPQKAAREWGATVVPFVVLVDPRHKILYMGAIDDNVDPSKVKHRYLHDAIASYLTAANIERPITEAVGTPILWKQTPPAPAAVSAGGEPGRRQGAP